MNAQARTPSAAPLHPALWVAAISVTAFSAVGIAALTGAFEHKAAETPAPVAAAAIQKAPVVTPPATRVAGEPESAPAPAVTVEPAPVIQPPLAQSQVDKPQAARAPTSEKAVAKAAAPKKVHVAEHSSAVPQDGQAVKVAQQTYDPGIDVTEAPPPPAHEPSVSRPDNEYRVPPTACADCGVVEAVRPVQAPGEASGLGAAAGGVVGGLLGNAVGKGTGNTIATILGVAGGAYAGHQIEKTQRKSTHYEVDVRMAGGERRTVTFDTEPVWRAGDKVKVQNGKLVAGN
ncbi:MAG TPA: glycine zipper 2TM domain-containing protein [Methyloversatilis sp.]